MFPTDVVFDRIGRSGGMGTFFRLVDDDGASHLAYHRRTCCLLYRMEPGEDLCHDCSVRPREDVEAELRDVALWRG